MADDYNPNLMNAVTEYLDGKGYHYQADRQGGTVFMGMRITCRSIPRVNVFIPVQRRSIPVFIYPEINGTLVNQLDTNNIDQMVHGMMFMTHANHNRFFSTFQLDQKTGTICSVYTQFCGDFVPPQELIDFTLTEPIDLWETYGDAYIDVIQHGRNPISAAEDAERNK